MPVVGTELEPSLFLRELIYLLSRLLSFVRLLMVEAWVSIVAFCFALVAISFLRTTFSLVAVLVMLSS